MGLHGAHARKKTKASDWSGKRRGRPPGWLNTDLSRVERVIRFLESLPITKGVLAGKRMRLLPGQRQFVETLYGRLDKDGRRLIRIAIKSEPRGNGKTGLLAALALCHLLGPEWEARGEVYSCAYNKLQAALIFAEMKAIIEAVPSFAERVNVQRYGKILEVMEGQGKGSIFESLSADDKRAHGLSPTLWIFDEFAQSPNSDLLDNLRTAMGKRAESLGVIISTQAANDQHPLSAMIDDGLLGQDPSVYVQLAAAAPDADLFDEATWYACNEALGIFLDLKEFRAQARQAKRLPSFQSRFQNLRLNQRIETSESFVSMDVWNQCGEPVGDLMECEEVYGGLDLSAVSDLTALVLIGKIGGVWHVEPHFWLPGDGLLERSRLDRTPYDVWHRQGFLNVSPGKAVDYEFVADQLHDIFAHYPVRVIAFDRWNFAQLKPYLVRAGIDEELIERKFVPFGQGFKSMSPALRQLEELLLKQQIAHGGHPVLRMCAANSTVQADTKANRTLIKKKSIGRIDGMVALAMAIGSLPEAPAALREPTYQMIFLR